MMHCITLQVPEHLDDANNISLLCVLESAELQTDEGLCLYFWMRVLSF